MLVDPLRRNRAFVVAAWLCIAAVTFAVPYQTTTAPRVTLHVLSPDGERVPKALVTEVWRDHSLEGAAHEESFRSDRLGTVKLPARVITAPFAERALGCMRNRIKHSPRAECGAVALAVVEKAGEVRGVVDLHHFGSGVGEIVLDERSVDAGRCVFFTANQ